MYEYWTSLVNFSPKYSALYHAFAHRIVFLISFLDSSLLVYKNTTKFGWLFCVLQCAKLVHLLALVAFLHTLWDLLYMMCLVAQLCPTLCDPMDCSPSGSSVYGDSPGKNTGVGCLALFQAIFSTRGWNPDLPHCR